MSYQVLARKWRPRSFGTMVGQEHVLRALINALDNERLHHAYLFTGTRGVGKTTIARIFAKSLNCENGVTSNPCGVCSACTEIDEGRFIDLIEVDAASRTKVEDTRELLENVQYAPTRGRYKVYLIDEVHMLSTHSFNALLKTLEEPPPHVKFLLATTDPQKLPVTILSRCLQFNLKRMSPEMIAGHLENVLKAEEVEYDNMALLQIADGADGSMRDALSLLDQAIAFGGGSLKDEEVRTMLGTIDRSYVFRLLQALASHDAQALLDNIQGLAQMGIDFTSVLSELISQLHKVALAQVAPKALDQMPDEHTLKDLASEISPEDVQLYYQIGITGRRDLPFAPDLRSGFEMIMLRMLAFRPVLVSSNATNPQPVSGQAPAPISGGGRTSQAATPQNQAQPANPAPAQQEAPAPTAAPSPSAAPSSSQMQPSGAGRNGSWHEIVSQLGLRGMAQQLAVNSVLTSREGDLMNLTLSQQHSSLRSPAMEQRLQEALSNYLGQPIRLNYSVGELSEETPAHMEQRAAEDRQQAAVNTIQNDPNVQHIRDTFGGEVITDSIQPVD